MARPVAGLGELERAIMEQVWREGRPVPGRVVVDALQQARSVAYTTVLTIMDRLVVKGLLTRERAGRMFVYRAVQSREEHTASLMREALERAEDPRAVLLHFTQQIRPEDAEELRNALKQATGQEPSTR